MHYQLLKQTILEDSILSSSKGVKKALAIDHDPRYCMQQKAMPKNNLTEAQVLCLFPGAFILKEKLDILLSIILAQPLMILATFKSFIKPQGICLVSAILRKQVKGVQGVYRERECQRIQNQYNEEWACLVGRFV